MALIIVATFGGHAVAGPNGILAWSGYNQDLQERLAELAELEAERDALKHRSTLLNPEKADPDLGEELIRRDLGLIREDEVVLPLE